MGKIFLNKFFSSILTRSDKILILFIALLIVITSIYTLLPKSSEPLLAICEIDGAEKCKIILGKDQTVDLKNGMVLEIKNNMIRVLKSDCKKQICIKHGWIKEANDMIICVPNKTVIYLDKKSEIDYISK